MNFQNHDLLPHSSSFPVSPAELKILHSAAEFKKELLKQISQAKQRIYLCSLYLQHDDAGTEIMAALKHAKN